MNRLDNFDVPIYDNVSMMIDIDTTAQSHMHSIDNLAVEYLSVTGFTKDKKNETMITQFDQAKEHGYKVQLPIQTDKSVDKHNRVLDSDAVRFDVKIQDKAIRATNNIKNGSQKRGRKMIKDKDIKNKTTSIKKEKIIKPTRNNKLKKGAKLRAKCKRKSICPICATEKKKK